jgi:5-methylcytosine-specific restriction endonuclease McrA
MSRASKICSHVGRDGPCPNIAPCPDHPSKSSGGWQRTTPRPDRLRGRRSERRSRYILMKYDTVCHVCGRPGADEVDHVIALAEGGPDTVENLRPIHGGPGSCHARKTADEAARGRARRAQR